MKINLQIGVLQQTVITLLLCFCISHTYGQFTILEDFKGSADPDVIIGDNAFLTSGIEDPVNNGWLRLTSDEQNQKGYAYVNRSFPSTLGVILDFEYKMWREVETTNGIHGADGFSIFLFDAQYGPGNFELGAYGGSLGYANSNLNPPNQNTPGLSGGYIGIGFDAYGNFTMQSEGKMGGSTGLSPNSITVRGPTTSNFSTSNPYLTGVTINPNNTTVDALLMSGDSEDNIIDFNENSSQRPINSDFYRRVQVEISPNTIGTYDIVVRWTKQYGMPMVELLNYTTNHVPPTLLKVGFAASTGSGVNNHEIRNLRVTTPDNVRVNKFANKNMLVYGTPSNNDDDVINYTIEIENDTDAQLNNVFFADSLTNGTGILIPDGDFEINSITTNGFINDNIPVPTSGNLITGNFTIGPQDIGYVYIEGTLNNPVSDNLLRNVVYINPTDITDEDMTNNTAVVATPVQSDDIDLVLNKTSDNLCTDDVNGNTFTLTVSNVGSSSANYGSEFFFNYYIRVIKTIPTGYTYNDSATNLGSSGWNRNISGNTYTYTIAGNGNIQSGFSFPHPIIYTLTPPSSSTSFIDSASLSYKRSFFGNESDVENAVNLTNNTASDQIVPEPDPPLVDSPIVYCFGETSNTLTATSDPGNSLLWYTHIGGFGSSIPPKPSTLSAGSTIYYVSQTNQNCESVLEQIQVIVTDPQPGTISGTQEVCSGISPATITSSTPGTGLGTISYKWEFSTDGGSVWTLIPSATQATLQPPLLTETTSFRRTTLDSFSDPNKVCESNPTTIVTVSVNNCHIITNPMLPSMAKK